MAYQPVIPELSRQELKTRIDSNDDERYHGDRNVNGERHGKGLYYFVSGDYYSGNWRKGRMEGQGMYVSARGERNIGWFYQNEYVGQLNLKLKYKIVKDLIPVHYSANALTREDVDYDERYVGNYKKRRRHGHGAFYSPDGSFYVGNWRKGRMEGKGKSVNADGEEFTGWFYHNDYVGSEPNKKLRKKIEKGIIPDPNATKSVYKEEVIDSDSGDEDIPEGAEGFEILCRKLAVNMAKKHK